MINTGINARETITRVMQAFMHNVYGVMFKRVRLGCVMGSTITVCVKTVWCDDMLVMIITCQYIVT